MSVDHRGGEQVRDIAKCTAMEVKSASEQTEAKTVKEVSEELPMHKQIWNVNLVLS